VAALAQRGAGQSRQFSYLPMGLGVAAGLGSIALCQVWSIYPSQLTVLESIHIS
jgi:hypothetical protein